MMAVPNEFFNKAGRWGPQAGAGHAEFALQINAYGLQHDGISVHSLIQSDVAANKDWLLSHGKHQSL
jgi:hypothetical protein